MYPQQTGFVSYCMCMMHNENNTEHWLDPGKVMFVGIGCLYFIFYGAFKTVMARICLSCGAECVFGGIYDTHPAVKPVLNMDYKSQQITQ